jgi:hypothetical protein
VSGPNRLLFILSQDLHTYTLSQRQMRLDLWALIHDTHIFILMQIYYLALEKHPLNGGLQMNQNSVSVR